MMIPPPLISLTSTLGTSKSVTTNTTGEKEQQEETTSSISDCFKNKSVIKDIISAMFPAIMKKDLL